MSLHSSEDEIQKQEKPQKNYKLEKSYSDQKKKRNYLQNKISSIDKDIPANSLSQQQNASQCSLQYLLNTIQDKDLTQFKTKQQALQSQQIFDFIDQCQDFEDGEVLKSSQNEYTNQFIGQQSSQKIEKQKKQGKLSKQQFEESMHISENIEKNERISQFQLSSLKQASGREINLWKETNQISLKDQKAESYLFWFIEFQEPDWLYLSNIENQQNENQNQADCDESNESLDTFIHEIQSKKDRKNSEKFK